MENLKPVFKKGIKFFPFNNNVDLMAYMPPLEAMKFIKKNYKGIEFDPIDESHLGCVWKISGSKYVLYLSGENLDYTLEHEALHIAIYICQYCGFNYIDDDGELLAYYQGDIIKTIKKYL